MSLLDEEAAYTFDLMFPMQVAEELPSMTYFHQEQADGQVNTVIYLTRKGHDLPPLARQ